MHQHHRVLSGRCAAQAEGRFAVRRLVVNGRGEQAAQPGDGVLVARHPHAALVAERRSPFARARGIESGARPSTRPARHQGALDESLGVQRQIVAALPKTAQEGAEFALALGGIDAPAAKRHRQDALYTGAERRDRLEVLLDDPVEPYAVTRRIGQGRQGMHDVAKRRHLGEQHVHGATARPGVSRQPSP